MEQLHYNKYVITKYTDPPITASTTAILKAILNNLRIIKNSTKPITAAITIFNSIL
jgi:hypothetical protein